MGRRKLALTTFAALTFLVFVLAPLLAFAADGAVVSAAIDISPVINAAIQIVGALLCAFGIPLIFFVINWVRKKQGLAEVQLSQAQQEQAETVWRRMIGYGVNATADMTAQRAASGTFMVTPGSPFMTSVLRYGVDHYADTLKAQGVINSLGQVDQEKLANILNARLGMLAVSQATAPATLASATATSTPTAASQG